MKFNSFTAAMLAAILLLTLTACSQTPSPTVSEPSNSIVQQTGQQNDSDSPVNEASSTQGAASSEEASASTGRDEVSQDESSPSDREEGSGEEAWKEALAEDLFNKYGVLPEYYEDLGNGIYQVYVEVGGEVVPFVTVDSATGNYHG